MIVLILALAPSGAARAGDPHEFADVGCNYCHRDGDRESASGSEDLRDDLDARCAKCHPACVHGRKHRGSRGTPSGMKTPLPLDRTGRMACYTCHDPHGDYLEATSRKKTGYLRLAFARREICFNCHRSGDGT